jgi:hypothetical protein
MLDQNFNNLGSKQCLSEHNFSPQHSQIINSTHNSSTYLTNLVYFILVIDKLLLAYYYVLNYQGPIFSQLILI